MVSLETVNKLVFTDATIIASYYRMQKISCSRGTTFEYVMFLIRYCGNLGLHFFFGDVAKCENNNIVVMRHDCADECYMTSC